MKKLIFIFCIGVSLLLTSCYGNSFQSTIVIKNNARYSYEYVISCDEISYKSGGIISSGSMTKTKVQSGHTYTVSTYDIISMQLHSSNTVYTLSDKTYTVTINH